MVEVEGLVVGIVDTLVEDMAVELVADKVVDIVDIVVDVDNHSRIVAVVEDNLFRTLLLRKQQRLIESKKIIDITGCSLILQRNLKSKGFWRQEISLVSRKLMFLNALMRT